MNKNWFAPLWIKMHSALFRMHQRNVLIFNQGHIYHWKYLSSSKDRNTVHCSILWEHTLYIQCV